MADLCNFKLKLPSLELPSIAFSLPSLPDLPSLSLSLPSFDFGLGMEIEISVGGVAGPTQIVGDEPRIKIKINIPAPEIPIPSFSLPALPSIQIPSLTLPTLDLDIQVNLNLKLPDVQLPSIGFSLPSLPSLTIPSLPAFPPECILDELFG